MLKIGKYRRNDRVGSLGGDRGALRWQAFQSLVVLWRPRKKKDRRRRQKETCRNPGLNQGPLDLQSNALPTELFRLLKVYKMFLGFVKNQSLLKSEEDYSILSVTCLSPLPNSALSTATPPSSISIFFFHFHMLSTVNNPSVRFLSCENRMEHCTSCAFFERKAFFILCLV